MRAEVGTLLATHLVGASGGQIAIQGIRNVDLSIDPAPALYATRPGPFQTVTLPMPAPPARWRLRATVDVGGTVSYRLFGRWISSPVTLAVDIDVFDIAITQPVDVDLTRPGDPVFAAAGNPDLRLQLDLSSPSPVLSTVAPVLTGLLDPVIRVALRAAAGVVQREVGLQQGLPTSFAWGRGGPALPPVPNPPALEPLTLDYLATVRRDLLPFGMVYSAMYDDPTPGQGVIQNTADPERPARDLHRDQRGERRCARGADPDGAAHDDRDRAPAPAGEAPAVELLLAAEPVRAGRRRHPLAGVCWHRAGPTVLGRAEPRHPALIPSGGDKGEEGLGRDSGSQVAPRRLAFRFGGGLAIIRSIVFVVPARDIETGAKGLERGADS